MISHWALKTMEQEDYILTSAHLLSQTTAVLIVQAEELLPLHHLASL